jgi:hypothetical protein
MLSCFYFGESAAVLPAFGKFTGKCCLKADINDTVFGILEKTVVKINSF